VPVFGGNGVAGFTGRPLVREATVAVGRVGQKCGEAYLSLGPSWITGNALYPRVKHRDFDVHFLALALTGAALNRVKNRNDLPLVTQPILHSVRIADIDPRIRGHISR
jgi:type I restriction enzyme S subunit